MVEYQVALPPVNLWNYTKIDYWRNEMTERSVDKKTEALKLALDELIFFEVAGLSRLQTLDVIIAIREALAEQPAQQQEPVAYLDEGLGAFYWAKDYKKAVGFTPLYTSPPASKPWVGLTDEERNWLRKRNQKHDDYAKAVEALLKEKNT